METAHQDRVLSAINETQLPALDIEAGDSGHGRGLASTFRSRVWSYLCTQTERDLCTHCDNLSCYLDGTLFGAQDLMRSNFERRLQAKLSALSLSLSAQDQSQVDARALVALICAEVAFPIILSLAMQCPVLTVDSRTTRSTKLQPKHVLKKARKFRDCPFQCQQ
eukprot:2140506-Rhodomonas_salina.1